MSRSAPAARRRTIVRDEEGGAFACRHCGRVVPAAAQGTRHRNHCPHCLWSLHVDVRPGDRAHMCRAPMEPVAMWVLPDGERRLIHRCTRCNTLRANRVAGDDCEEAMDRIAGALDNRR